VSRRRRRSYGAARLPAVVTPSAGPRDTRTGSPSRLLLLLLVAVLTGILTLLVGPAGSANAVTSTASGAVATTAHTASGPTGAAAETRVGASTVAVASLVGAADGIAAGQRRGEGSLRPGFVSATSVAAEDGVSAATPVGRRGSPLNVPRGTNGPASIGGRSYGGHALDEMQSEGLTPSVVDDAIVHGQVSVGGSGRVAYYSPGNNITVITESDGKIVTVTSGAVKIR